jgi:hypothetical protein
MGKSVAAAAMTAIELKLNLELHYEKTLAR